MSFKKYLYRGARFVFKGIPENKISVDVSYTQPDRRLGGKKIVITGGGRGLGFAMAKKFADEGAIVLIAGRNEKTLQNSSKELGCQYLKLDVQQVDSFEAFMNKAWNMLDGIDCLVNNAGVSHHESTFLEVDTDDFDAQINTNLRGAYFLTQEYVRKFLSAGHLKGNVLFVSSERGMMVDDLPYGISKVAVNCLVQGLARTLLPKGIRVNAVAPGVTTSDMTGVTKDDNLYRESQMMSRVYLPEEVAEVACFLLSDISAVLNGQIIVCNEGKSINYKR